MLVLHAAVSALDRVLEGGAEHARMIALTFGALVAVSLAALLIWFVLSDKLWAEPRRGGVSLAGE